jgi:hypothetical protein
MVHVPAQGRLNAPKREHKMTSNAQMETGDTKRRENIKRETLNRSTHVFIHIPKNKGNDATKKVYIKIVFYQIFPTSEGAQKNVSMKFCSPGGVQKRSHQSVGRLVVSRLPD